MERSRIECEGMRNRGTVFFVFSSIFLCGSELVIPSLKLVVCQMCLGFDKREKTQLHDQWPLWYQEKLTQREVVFYLNRLGNQNLWWTNLATNLAVHKRRSFHDAGVRDREWMGLLQSKRLVVNWYCWYSISRLWVSTTSQFRSKTNRCGRKRQPDTTVAKLKNSRGSEATMISRSAGCQWVFKHLYKSNKAYQQVSKFAGSLFQISGLVLKAHIFQSLPSSVSSWFSISGCHCRPWSIQPGSGQSMVHRYLPWAVAKAPKWWLTDHSFDESIDESLEFNLL